MATLGTITQLPKEFFLSAATLAGDGNQKQDLAEQPAAIIGDQQPEQAAANETRDRQAHESFMGLLRRAQNESTFNPAAVLIVRQESQVQPV